MKWSKNRYLFSFRTVRVWWRNQFSHDSNQPGFPRHCGEWSPAPTARGAQEEKGDSSHTQQTQHCMSLVFMGVWHAGEQQEEHPSLHQAAETDHRRRICRERHRLVVQVLRLCGEGGSSVHRVVFTRTGSETWAWDLLFVSGEDQGRIAFPGHLWEM